MTIEAVCNQALDLIGYKRHIGNIYEGTVAARAALDLWGQTRDVLLVATKPMWARKDVQLVLLKSAPNIVNGTANYTAPWTSASPPLPWLYEYVYPTECLVPLQIKISPLFLPVWRPQFRSFRYNFDAATGNKTILCNDADAILNCIQTVLDPDDWPNDFTELMVHTLSQKFSVELAPELAHQKGQQQNANPSS